jgi:calcineurin-like phosphoesterase family protein
MTHVASDLHLGHKNIIEYCERPFDSVSEMNDTLLKNWNECVGPNERVLYLGDLAPFEDRTHVVQGWLNKLNGQFLFIEGNHDPAIPITTHESYCLNLSGSGSDSDSDVYLTHYPEDIPNDWDGWAIYGHHHNNFPEKYPFVDPHAKRVNISIELLGFEPIPVAELFRWIEAGDRLITRPGVNENRALQDR